MSKYNISQKLLELRNSKGVTQSDVANSLSVSNKTVSKWENGVSEPNIDMLIALANYYEISTDELLGAAHTYPKGAMETIRNEIVGSEREDVIFKSFNMVKTVTRSVIESLHGNEEAVFSDNDIIPSVPSFGNLKISMSSAYFSFLANRKDTNIAVTILKNEENFKWMKDPHTQKRMIRIFEFLSDGDALSVCHFIHSVSCSESFTADYVSKATGIPEEKCKDILTRLCAISNCKKTEAHLKNGIQTIYTTYGDGLLLSIISIAYEQTNPSQLYDCNIRGRCKMIGE